MRVLRAGVLGCTLGALVVALAACGSSGAKKAAAQTTTTTVPGRGAALQAFRTCMSSHGFTITLPQRNTNGGTPGSGSVPDANGDTGGSANAGAGAGGGFGGGGGGGFGAGAGEGFARRLQTPPAGADPTKYAAAYDACKSTLPQISPQQQQQFASARKAYDNCLAQHGVTVTTNAQGNPDMQAIRSQASFQSANQVCQALLPQRPQSTSTTAAAG